MCFPVQLYPGLQAAVGSANHDKSDEKSIKNLTYFLIAILMVFWLVLDLFWSQNGVKIVSKSTLDAKWATCVWIGKYHTKRKVGPPQKELESDKNLT